MVCLVMIDEKLSLALSLSMSGPVSHLTSIIHIPVFSGDSSIIWRICMGRSR